ncbi:MAG: hypothetical protein ACLFQV_06900 [Vulcanimicrobiota bacterium]
MNIKQKIITFIIFITILAIGPSFAYEVSGQVVKVDRKNKNVTIKKTEGFITRASSLKNLFADELKVSIESVFPGDRVKITGDGAGKSTINGLYRSGELLFINPHKIILSTGDELYFSDDTVFYINGLETTGETIKPGFRVFARLNPDNYKIGTLEAVDINKEIPNLDEEQLKPTDINITGIHKWGKGASKKYPDFKIGESVNFVLKAPSGLNVTVDITGVARGIELKETARGIYRSTYTFTRADVKRAYIIFHISHNELSTYRIYPGSINVASTPPVIKEVFPQPGARINGQDFTLTAVFSTPASIIMPENISLYLDGQVIISGQEKTTDFLTAQIKGLKPGKHQAKLIVEDQAGNTTRKVWVFYID